MGNAIENNDEDRVVLLNLQLTVQTKRANDLDRHLQKITGSMVYRYGLKLPELRVRWAPVGSRREKAARFAYKGFSYLREHGLMGLVK
jgi:hypothetical protein